MLYHESRDVEKKMQVSKNVGSEGREIFLETGASRNIHFTSCAVHAIVETATVELRKNEARGYYGPSPGAGPRRQPRAEG
jgi:hypothetical protein